VAKRSPDSVLEDLGSVCEQLARSMADGFKRRDALFVEGKRLGLTYVAMSQVAGITPEAVRQATARKEAS